VKSCFANHVKAETLQNSYKLTTPPLLAAISVGASPADAAEIRTVAEIREVAAAVDFITYFPSGKTVVF
jgi:protein gp37